jgi:hypothetical protein
MNFRETPGKIGRVGMSVIMRLSVAEIFKSYKLQFFSQSHNCIRHKLDFANNKSEIL